MPGPERFLFLNEEGGLDETWNPPNRSRLWVYNLHYFDDLNAREAQQRNEWHGSLIRRWIPGNPPGKGTGWEPYPTSLRIVNWTKWALAGNVLPREALESLAVQTRFLNRRLEYHLLGNHLFANAKALIFAGHFFEGQEADIWAKRGVGILERELHEQILTDGGHFELSPMYHSIILEDLLDLINISECYSTTSFSHLHITDFAQRMLAWLRAMCHPDDGIALFNDAAFGTAPQPDELFTYAEKLDICDPSLASTVQSSLKKSGVDTISSGNATITHLIDSGYIRVDNGPMTAILDVGRIGPDHLPGHAHADTLSFELSLFGRRVIVDSGTSGYDEGPERLEQRSTGAHNTVVVNGENSSQVWGSFRVGRRARTFGLAIKKDSEDSLVIRCAHDGYVRLSGKPIHWREWRFNANSLTIIDSIQGNCISALGRFYFHPDRKVITEDAGLQGEIRFSHDTIMTWRILKGHGKVSDAHFYPEFGLSRPNLCLELSLSDMNSQIIFEW